MLTDMNPSERSRARAPGSSGLTPLHERLKALRLDKGLSVSSLAAAAGISKAYLSQLEAGQREHPSLKTLEAIAGALSIPASELLPTGEAGALPASNSPVLRELLDKGAIDSANFEMLASIRFAGLAPRTEARWIHIWNAIRTSELLDTEAEVATRRRPAALPPMTPAGLTAGIVPSRSELLAPSPDDRPGWPRLSKVPRERWTDRDNPLAEFWPAELDECPREGLYLKVSRQAVFDVARSAGDSPDGALRLLVATYAWTAGGHDPRTVHRAKAMLSPSGRDQVGSRLTAAIRELAERGPVAAYGLLGGDEGRAHTVRGLGPAIFTKFFYFAGGVEAERSAGPLRPLILDQRVALAFGRFAAGELSAGESPRSSPWPTDWYRRYLEIAHKWAEELRIEPDVVEWLLWSRSSGKTRRSPAVPPPSGRQSGTRPESGRRSWADMPIGDEEPARPAESQGSKRAWSDWDVKVAVGMRSETAAGDTIREGSKP
jgi:transcriptional regulator with XRE-family HTH domain